jgi:AbrB family looped-hinge helix DNA binding protein
MTGSTIDTRGRTTVPAEIRAAMGAQAGTRLVWSASPDGTAIVRAKVAASRSRPPEVPGQACSLRARRA